VNVIAESVAPPDWDRYVESHPMASTYHRAAVVALGRAAFGLHTIYLCARDEHGALVGVLPLVEQSSAFFGRFLVSLPFVTYGGILARDESVAQALALRAAALGRERKCAHVELRHLAPGLPGEFATRLDKVSMMLDLPPSEAELQKTWGAKLRSQIRRADRESPEILWGHRELLDDFYGVFAQAMHELGTPVYPRRFFDEALRAFGPAAAVLVIRVGGAAQAAAMVVDHPRSHEVPWAAATPQAKKTSLNMRLYWEMIRRAVRDGKPAFDFGRSTRESGTYRFKAQWGARPVQLFWHYWLAEGGALPVLNQSNPKYARAAGIWRRMPLWCANAIGPHIAKHLP
jgi:FemAB-related protein (PEP-CTERM system-associated)